MHRMTEMLRKWIAVLGVYFQEGIAYRANGVLWILTDAVPAMVMPAVLAASTSNGQGMAGYAPNQFAQYYLVMVLLTNFITCHLMWELAAEIREGVFTVNLLRPISYFQVCLIRNITWRFLRLVYFIPIMFVMMAMYWTPLRESTYHWSAEALVAILLGHLVSFSLAYMLTMLALIFQETTSMFSFYYFPMLFLSGQLFPIYLMPDWIVSVAKALPFYYTTALPTDLVLGRVAPVSSHPMLLIQVAWIATHLLIARALWSFGIKRYTAVGM